ncbi:PPOX class F420-dependent oxidoreductase [Rhodococcus spongiicola]|uniref:PPOX class F420-dependent oxidoreductase n=1 Tax=Rhodococcus spongiicola TaxID=2487352 RepID=A0A438B6D5_9NOCA|nr:PPOX class F420-dependent oxidoreductase [Rhodococcus spongiicola]RVW06482.1 PPOX class F420-dependent oxidoreductase [Rhodococcus spongiicola]
MSTEVSTPRPLLDLVASQNKAVLVTVKRDGRPQLSNVMYAWDPDTRTARVSVTADRAKTRNAARDPRVSLHVSSPDFWSYAVVEGDADLSPVAADPMDSTVGELVELYRGATGSEHEDWDAFRRAMVDERRLVLRISTERIYGMA